MTALQSWPDHFLTLDEWNALELDERFRYELVEGVLTIMVRARPRHGFATTNVTHRACEQLPQELIALAEVEVIVERSPLTIRVPDMIVTRTQLFDADLLQFEASDVLVATEVLSDGTRAVDRIHKFGEYAEAGIPHYWIIDIDGPVTLRAFELVDGSYKLVREHTGVATLEVAGHTVHLDLDTLVRR